MRTRRAKENSQKHVVYAHANMMMSVWLAASEGSHTGTAPCISPRTSPLPGLFLLLLVDDEGTLRIVATHESVHSQEHLPERRVVHR